MGGAAGGDATALQPKASLHPGSQSHNPTNTAQPHALTAPPRQVQRGKPEPRGVTRADGGRGGGTGGARCPKRRRFPSPGGSAPPRGQKSCCSPPSPHPQSPHSCAEGPPPHTHSTGHGGGAAPSRPPHRRARRNTGPGEGKGGGGSLRVPPPESPSWCRPPNPLRAALRYRRGRTDGAPRKDPPSTTPAATGTRAPPLPRFRYRFRSPVPPLSPSPARTSAALFTLKWQPGALRDGTGPGFRLRGEPRGRPRRHRPPPPRGGGAEAAGGGPRCARGVGAVRFGGRGSARHSPPPRVTSADRSVPGALGAPHPLRVPRDASNPPRKHHRILL